MKVTRVRLKNFRNIESTELEPDAHLNFLVGKNAQGKTSVVESLALLATLRSFRNAKSPDLIQRGTESTSIECQLRSSDLDDQDWDAHLRVNFQMTDPISKKASKVAFINGKAVRSSTRYLGHRYGPSQIGFHTIIFHPADHELMRGTPSLRRQYLNRVASAEDVEYLGLLQKVTRLLEQRNAILREGWSSQNQSMLRGFTEQLVEFGAQLTLRRMIWLERLEKKINRALERVAPSQHQLGVTYSSNWVRKTDEKFSNNKQISGVHFAGHWTPRSIEELEQDFWKHLSTLEKVEWNAKTTLVGPHRDDWNLFFDDEPIKSVGSQGEIRSALIALKLSEIELYRDRSGFRPILLIDDFSSELDESRREFLLKYLEETDLQVFVTTTEHSVQFGKKFWVNQGNIKAHDRDERIDQQQLLS